MSDKRIGTYSEAMRQATREARMTCVALAFIVVVWLVGGFGLAGLGIEVFHTPLWVIGGCVMPWVAAIVAAVVLSRRVFRDFDLDAVARPADKHDAGGENAALSSGDAPSPSPCDALSAGRELVLAASESNAAPSARPVSGSEGGR